MADMMKSSSRSAMASAKLWQYLRRQRWRYQRLLRQLRAAVRWFGWREALPLWGAAFGLTGVEAVVHSRHVPAPLHVRPADLPLYGQIIERAAYALPWSRAPRVVIDAGAHIGFTAIYLAHHYPQAQIYSLEPAASNFRLLRTNAAFYPQITPIHAALWNEATELDVVTSNRQMHPGTFRTLAPTAATPFQITGQVTATTVPHLLADYNIDFIDLLKVDIEGAEKEVLAEAEAWIERVGVIIMEPHDRFHPGCTEAFLNATRAFDLHWQQGEHLIAARREFVTYTSNSKCSPRQA
jgi:FkbM family methyltransferase